MIAAQQTKRGIRNVDDLGMCPEIGSSEVHIWRADLDAFAMTLSADDFLAQDERNRAMRFHFERDRRRFRAGRQILRLLLGRYPRTASQNSEAGKRILRLHSMYRTPIHRRFLRLP